MSCFYQWQGNGERDFERPLKTHLLLSLGHPLILSAENYERASHSEIVTNINHSTLHQGEHDQVTLCGKTLLPKIVSPSEISFIYGSM